VREPSRFGNATQQLVRYFQNQHALRDGLAGIFQHRHKQVSDKENMK
jgi:hypothetical protein